MNVYDPKEEGSGVIIRDASNTKAFEWSAVIAIESAAYPWHGDATVITLVGGQKIEVKGRSWDWIDKWEKAKGEGKK